MSSPIVLSFVDGNAFSFEFNLQEIESYLDALRLIKDSKDEWEGFRHGICAVSEIKSGLCVNTYPLTAHLSKPWEKHSGNANYPIPNLRNSESDYDLACDREPYYDWNPESRVGKLRWELLDFLIEESENLLKQYQESIK